MNNREYIYELFRLVPTDSILVIDRYGKIRRIFCPFKVIVIKPIGDHNVGKELFVDAVKMSEELKDVYIIEWKAYYPFYFKILG